MDTMIVQQLLWELKPATIFEMGTHEGGSALWMADTMRSYGCNSQVYTVDLDTETIKPLAKQDKNITLVTGDLMKVEELLPAKMLQVWIDPSLFFFCSVQRGLLFLLLEIKDTNPSHITLRTIWSCQFCWSPFMAVSGGQI